MAGWFCSGRLEESGAGEEALQGALRRAASAASTRECVEKGPLGLTVSNRVFGSID